MCCTMVKHQADHFSKPVDPWERVENRRGKSKLENGGTLCHTLLERVGEINHSVSRLIINPLTPNKVHCKGEGESDMTV